jgi:predicted metal-dependent hydrolase
MKSLVKGSLVIPYEIKYKSIKHIYFRPNDGYILVTASNRFKEENILHVMNEKFDTLYRMLMVNSRIQIPKYQLWGKALSEEEFFSAYNLKPNEKNYHLILKQELKKKVLSMMDQLTVDLDKINLKPVEHFYKPLKSKFGACLITKKQITLSTFLARIDEIYLYYVLLHEYAHLIVPNHSKSFYKVLDVLMINHKTIQKNLRKHVISF